MSDLPKIYGINKNAEAGSNPFAWSIFLSGCNFSCNYCMNSRLVNSNDLKEVSFEKIKEEFSPEKNKMIIISGGEPLLENLDKINNLIIAIKELGGEIGLCTNGSYPEKLEKIINNIKYVAMDIKSSRKDIYQSICNSPNVLDSILKSKSILESSKIDYEIRTTLFPPFITEEDIEKIGPWIKLDEFWVLQRFRKTTNMMDRNCCVIPYTEEQNQKMLNIAKKYADKAILRYV